MADSIEMEVYAALNAEVRDLSIHMVSGDLVRDHFTLRIEGMVII